VLVFISGLRKLASVSDSAFQAIANSSIELDDHEHVLRHVEIAQCQASRMRGLESKPRVVLRMADDDNGRIPMLTARFESGANQPTADSRALILRPNRHRSETGDSKSNRRFETDWREQDMSDDRIVPRCNQRDRALCPSQALDDPRFHRRTECELVDLTNTGGIGRLLEPDTNHAR
jgi:hypothetical protein